MLTRPLGRTGLDVSVVGLGCAPLGDEYHAVSDAEGEAAVRHAIERGVTLVDVAPYYGRTLAEERLGRALEGLRERVVLATKCARRGRRRFDFSAAGVRADMEGSLRRLRTDVIDLYQVHDCEFGDEDQIVEETLPTLRALQAEGKARFVGITGLALGCLRRIAERAPVDTILSYCHGNLMVGDVHRALGPLCDGGVGLLNASVLHMGILSESGPQDWHPAPEAVRAVGREVAALCARRGVSLSQVALRAALDDERVASTLVGMRTVAEVDHDLQALEQRSDPELLAEIAALVEPVRDVTWHEGLPQNDDRDPSGRAVRAYVS